MSLWRPSDAPRRTTPTFQPIVAREELTDDERARLAAVRSVYPYLEFTTTRREMNRLMLLRWEFGKTKDLQ